MYLFWPSENLPACIKHTDIYISSDKFVMNGPISMEFDSIHSHCHDNVISTLNIVKNFACRGVSRTSATRSKKIGTSGNPPSANKRSIKCEPQCASKNTEFGLTVL
jgi:hypothetical protein